MSRVNTSAVAGGLFSFGTLWVALAFIAGIAGVALSFACWSQSSAPTGVWATVLLLAAPALGVVGTPVEYSRDGAPAVLEATFDRLDRAVLALKLVQGTRAVLFTGNSFSLVLWFCESGGITNSRQFVLPYTVICLGALVLLLPWLASRERRALEVLAFDSQALKEVKAGREWLVGDDERNPPKQVL
jgi:hypothetical protein